MGGGSAEKLIKTFNKINPFYFNYSLNFNKEYLV
jgi:hypothetical protein